MKSLVENAALLAIKWHNGQLRKDGKPFIIHPLMVGQILAQNGFSEDVIAAGLCHDLLEDTDCPPEEIAEHCNPHVLAIVQADSDDPKLKNDWEARKQAQIDKLYHATNDIRAVYVADKIHNTLSIIEEIKTHGPSFWQKFSRGKEIQLEFDHEILKALRQTWDHPLIEVYADLIEQKSKL